MCQVFRLEMTKARFAHFPLNCVSETIRCVRYMKSTSIFSEIETETYPRRHSNTVLGWMPKKLKFFTGMLSIKVFSQALFCLQFEYD